MATTTSHSKQRPAASKRRAVSTEERASVDSVSKNEWNVPTKRKRGRPRKHAPSNRDKAGDSSSIQTAASRHGATSPRKSSGKKRFSEESSTTAPESVRSSSSGSPSGSQSTTQGSPRSSQRQVTGSSKRYQNRRTVSSDSRNNNSNARVQPRIVSAGSSSMDDSNDTAFMWQKSKRRRSPPQLFVASPWNDEPNETKQAAVRREIRKKSVEPKETKRKRLRIDTNPEELQQQYGFSKRRRAPPAFFVASPWNDNDNNNDDETVNEEHHHQAFDPSKLSVAQQRKCIAVGQKVKTLFKTEMERNGKTQRIKKWYKGKVVEVLAKGAKIRVEYQDGDEQVESYPNKDIELVGDIILNEDSDSSSDEKDTKLSRGSRRQRNASTRDEESNAEAMSVVGTRKSSRRVSLEEDSDKDSPANNKKPSSFVPRRSSARRQRAPPKFFVASPWNDEPSDNEREHGFDPSRLSVEEQRRTIAVGQKVKTCFDAEYEEDGSLVPTKKWYRGKVVQVLSGGAQIRVQYHDGDVELEDYPRDDIRLVGDIILKEESDEEEEVAAEDQVAKPDNSKSTSEAGAVEESDAAVEDEAMEVERTVHESDGEAKHNEETIDTQTTPEQTSETEEAAEPTSEAHVQNGSDDDDEAPDEQASENESVANDGDEDETFLEHTETDEPSSPAEVSNDEATSPVLGNSGEEIVLLGRRVKGLYNCSLKRDGQIVQGKKWYEGSIIEVLSGGTKIRIRYDDGDVEVVDYPSKRIALVEQEDRGVVKSNRLVEEQRKSMAVGQKVKVRFLVNTSGKQKEGKKKTRWYKAKVTRVIEGGSRIQVQYSDGSREVLNYPDKDIVLGDSKLLNHSWDEMFASLCEFKQVHGHCNVQSVGADSHRCDLSTWAERQRCLHGIGQLPPAHHEKLASLGFQFTIISSSPLESDNHKMDGKPAFWDPAAPSVPSSNESHAEDHWSRMFVRLQQYTEKHCHCVIPIDYDEDPELAQWAEEQRQSKLMLPRTHQRQLERLGFSWTISQRNWELGFKSLVKFKNEYGHCRVPYGHTEKWLGEWVSLQRRLKSLNQLPANQVNRLEAIDFEWNIKVGKPCVQ